MHSFICLPRGRFAGFGRLSSPPRHRNGAWGCVVPEARRLAPCGVRPGGCGVTLPRLTEGLPPISQITTRRSFGTKIPRGAAGEQLSAVPGDPHLAVVTGEDLADLKP